MSTGQISIPGAYIRGGSSKALFLHETAIPGPGPLRDRVLKRLMGTPDPQQIDGMGGARVVTSKVAIVRPSEREDADVEYTFAQVGIEGDGIGYAGNCGNISAAVGPFAVDEGLIKTGFRRGKAVDGAGLAREVRIWQTGTKKVLIAHVPVDKKTGMSVSRGNFAIAGVPGTGAPILMDFRNTIGASCGRGVVPTGNSTDTLTVGGKAMEVSICDVANVCIFVLAADMGITGSESARAISADKALIARCKELRGKAAQLLGMCKDWELVDKQSPGLPLVVMVSRVQGREAGSHLVSRLLLNNTCHDSMAGTGATCTAACSRIAGSVVNKVMVPEALEENVLQISHPIGVMPVWVEASVDGKSAKTVQLKDAEFNVLAFVRTSRRIMEGKLFLSDDIWDGVSGKSLAGENGHDI